jgi:hypothetical protein
LIWFLLAGLLAACTPSPPQPISLTLEVKPSQRPGWYLLNGTTNLPNQSRINVAAVRYLHEKTVQAQFAAADTDYAILARQTIEVTQGEWRATLNLWQIAADGRYQEAWQLNQTQRMSRQPAETVSFIATFEPDNQPPEIQQQVEPKNMVFDSGLMRVNSDGQRYLQATQTIPVNLPFGKTTPPATTTADRNGGWGDRASLRNPNSIIGTVKPAVPINRKTNAPLSTREFAR